MPEETMREAFERTNGRDHRRNPPKGNNYIDPLAQADWESFQKGWNQSREALRQALQAITTQVDGNIRPTVRECINGQNNVQDIYGYCDQIESIAAAAMKEPQP